jgi:hypothetical protein
MRFYVFIPLLNPCYGAKHVVDQFTNHPPEIANDLVENATQEAAVNQAQNSKKMGGGAITGQQTGDKDLPRVPCPQFQGKQSSRQKMGDINLSWVLCLQSQANHSKQGNQQQ